MKWFALKDGSWRVTLGRKMGRSCTVATENGGGESEGLDWRGTC